MLTCFSSSCWLHFDCSSRKGKGRLVEALYTYILWLYACTVHSCISGFLHLLSQQPCFLWSLSANVCQCFSSSITGEGQEVYVASGQSQTTGHWDRICEQKVCLCPVQCRIQVDGWCYHPLMRMCPPPPPPHSPFPPTPLPSVPFTGGWLEDKSSYVCYCKLWFSPAGARLVVSAHCIP